MYPLFYRNHILFFSHITSRSHFPLVSAHQTLAPHFPSSPDPFPLSLPSEESRLPGDINQTWQIIFQKYLLSLFIDAEVAFLWRMLIHDLSIWLLPVKLSYLFCLLFYFRYYLVYSFLNHQRRDLTPHISRYWIYFKYFFFFLFFSCLLSLRRGKKELFGRHTICLTQSWDIGDI